MEYRKEVSTMGERIIGKLFELDDYEYRRDEEVFYVEAYIAIALCYKSCEVECSVTWEGDEIGKIECLLYPHDKKKELVNLEDAVNDYLQEHLDTKALLAAMEKMEDKDDMDIFQRNGFRDAADYYNWRYA